MKLRRRWERLVFNVGGGKVRYDTLDGEECIVAPASVLAPGVWNGTQGNVYYPENVLEEDPSDLDHRPIVLDHPKTKPSACDPAILNACGVGITLNSEYDGKVRTEAWMKTRRLKELDVRVLEKIKAGKPVEVSSGIFMQYKRYRKPQTKDGKEYKLEAKKIKYDHLAVEMKGKRGAYGLKDGGGLFVTNSLQGLPERTVGVVSRSLEEALKPLGFTVVENELSFSDTTRALCELVAQTYGSKGQYFRGYVADVFEDRVVFYGEDGKLYQVGYTVSDKEGVNLKGEAVQVTKQSDYVPVSNSEDEDVAKETVFDKKDRIKRLIACGRFDEDDRKDLEKMSDGILEKIRPTKPKVEVVNNSEDDDEDEVPVRKPKVSNRVKRKGQIRREEVDEPEPKAKSKKVTFNELKEDLKTANPELLDFLEGQEEAAKAEKEELVEVLNSHPRNPYSEEELKKMKLKDLRKAVHLAGPNEDEEDDDEDETEEDLEAEEEDEDLDDVRTKTGKDRKKGSYAGAAVPVGNSRRPGKNRDREPEPLKLPVWNAEAAAKAAGREVK
jgi:hypothetical protein